VSEIEPDDVVSAWQIDPRHEVTDRKHAENIIRSMKKNGWDGRPLLVIPIGEEDGKMRYKGITGSHRWYAAYRTDTPVPIVIADVDADVSFDRFGRIVLTVADGEEFSLEMIDDENLAEALRVCGASERAVALAEAEDSANRQ
jgi:hypothetical protein